VAWRWSPAARRLGRAIALELAAQGWDVAVHCNRSRDEADALATQIRGLGRRAAVLQADLSDEAATARLIPACIDALGVPACLVNNASLFQYDVATSFSYGSLDTHMRTNVAARCCWRVRCTRRLAPMATRPGSSAL
jgi:NAD(P)-dependent dehydrogenase (short-subunit alcohol dehydrogenase family)